MNSGLFRGNQGDSSGPFLAKGCLQFVCFFLPLLCDLVFISGGTRRSFSRHERHAFELKLLSCEELRKAVAASSAFHFPFLK